MEKGNQTQEIQEENIVVENKTEDTTSEETIENVEPESFLEIQYNKEQLKLDKEKAKELAQKGMNYDKAVERAKQEARDAYIAEQNYEWNGKPIKNEAEYNAALNEQKLREQYQDLPEDVQNELIESKKFREEYTKQQQESQRQAKQQEDYKLFLETFPNTEPKDIPQTVWDQVNKGKSLVDAFTFHENQLLKDQIAKLKEGKDVEKINTENEQASTGSIKGQGATKPARFTAEQVANMNEAEVNRNWDAINESMKAWKK